MTKCRAGFATASHPVSGTGNPQIFCCRMASKVISKLSATLDVVVKQICWYLHVILLLKLVADIFLGR